MRLLFVNFRSVHYFFLGINSPVQFRRMKHNNPKFGRDKPKFSKKIIPLQNRTHSIKVKKKKNISKKHFKYYLNSCICHSLGKKK